MIGPNVIVEIKGTEEELGYIQGRTFQIHKLPNGKFNLILVKIIKPDMRCPAIIGGDQCGLSQGHEGKHLWASGD